MSPRKSVVQSYCQCEVTFRVSDFQNGEQSVHRREGKNIEFITEIVFWFLGFGNITISLAIENQTLILFWNETSSGEMNFNDSFLSSGKFSEHLYRPVTQFRHSNNRFIKGYTKLKVAVVLALQSQWIPIWIPLKFPGGGSLIYFGYIGMCRCDG